MNIVRVSSMVVLLGILCAAGSLQAATYYVDQGAPNASDENPGTEEQPWKMLRKAIEATTKGDKAYVRAGKYREALELTGQGVTIRAFGDDAVVLEPADEITEIRPGAWERVPGQEFVYVCEPGVGGADRNWRLQVEGMPIAFEVTQGVRREITSPISETRMVTVDRTLEDDDGRRWSLDRDGKLYVNLMGEDAAQHRIELVKPGPGGVSLRGRNCRVKGLELHNCGIGVSGQGNVVEDCLVLEGHGSMAGMNIIRRCAFYRCPPIHIGTHAVFEENLVVGGQRWVPELQPPQVDRQLSYYVWGRAIGFNAAHYQLHPL